MVKENKKILVVENNKEYLKNAKEAFGDKAIYVENYKDALKTLKKEKLDGVLIDIFIPETKEKDLGNIGKKLYQDIENKIYELRLKKVKEIIQKEQPDVHEAIKRYFKYVKNKNIKHINELDNKEFGEFFDKFGLKRLYNNEKIDNYEDAINKEKEKGHAPLGILLAKEAEKKGIDFVFVTDANHHNEAIQGLIETYFVSHPKIIFGYGYKSIYTWKDAYKILKK